MSTLAQREEPLLLQAADESLSLSIFLSGLPAHRARARSHVPHRVPVAKAGKKVQRESSKIEAFVFQLIKNN